MREHDGGLPRELNLSDDFPTPTIDDWRRAAEASLRGRSLEDLTVRLIEGLDIRPLYTSRDVDVPAGAPGEPPYTRGRTPHGVADGWQNAPRVDHPDLATARDRIGEAIAGGAGALWIRAAAAARLGLDPDHARAAAAGLDGVVVATAGDVDELLGPVATAPVPLHLDAGGASPALLALTVAGARRRGVEPSRLAGSTGLDPLAALAADGEDPFGSERSLRLLADVSAWAGRHAPALRAVTVSTMPYHGAGATVVHELAFAMSTAVVALRAAESVGGDPAVLAGQIRFVQPIGRDVFLGIATLRALRRLWHRVATACGVSGDGAAAFVHAVTSPRTLTARDPWTNMLRTTTQTFAAVAGGADVVTTLEFDRRLGPPDALGRRMARNTQTILRDEAHLDRTTDPAGGAWYVEWLTDELARRSWELFQELERAGGMRNALHDGRVTAMVSDALAARRRAIAHRHDPVTGVSTWPLLDERRPDPTALDTDAIHRAASRRTVDWRAGHSPDAALDELARTAETGEPDGSITEAAIEAAAAGATLGQLVVSLRQGAHATRFVPFPSEPAASMFERLRDASDRHLEATGRRPAAFLANLGPVAEHVARATFARNLLAAGGIAGLDAGELGSPSDAAEAFGASGADVAVICSSDARYAADAAEAARRLKAAGARMVVLAGRPGPSEAEWRQAGVDRFISAGGDAHADLVAILAELGVTT